MHQHYVKITRFNMQLKFNYVFNDVNIKRNYISFNDHHFSIKMLDLTSVNWNVQMFYGILT
jgi:hypothetical protein